MHDSPETLPGAAEPRSEPTRSSPRLPLRQFADHSRNWRANRYVYPVISRRSGGLSIGINLNPSAACNFDCIYCQVDRTVRRRTRAVEPALLDEELRALTRSVVNGSFFQAPEFADVPPSLRRLIDFAFSGDGEPTTCPVFAEAVQLVADLKNELGLGGVKIALITDACYLTKPPVEAGLAILDANEGEVWAKLDAGTEEYYRLVNRPNLPLQHVLDNIIHASQSRAVVIQSLFMRVHGRLPPESELDAYSERLNAIGVEGGRIDHVQVYTIARAPAEPYVTPLTREEIDGIADRTRAATGLCVEAYSAAGTPS